MEEETHTIEVAVPGQEPENTDPSRINGKFAPGYSGNPKGKPKGALSITAAIRKFLDEHPERFEELFHEYLEDKKHRELLWKMLDGMPKQQTEITGDQALPFTIHIVKDDAKQDR